MALCECVSAVLHHDRRFEFCTCLLVVFHCRKELVLAVDKRAAADEVVCTELAKLLDFCAQVFALALDAFDFAHGAGFGFGDDDLGFFLCGGLHFVNRALHVNGFTHIFSGGYSAGYYGYKWSEVMSADCYGAFEEAGLDDDAAIRRTGARYRETILGMGGSESAYDVFVKFRGRRPTSAALLRQQGLA